MTRPEHTTPLAHALAEVTAEGLAPWLAADRARVRVETLEECAQQAREAARALPSHFALTRDHLTVLAATFDAAAREIREGLR